MCVFVSVYLTAAKSKRKIVASPFLKPNTIPFSEFLLPPFLFCIFLQHTFANYLLLMFIKQFSFCNIITQSTLVLFKLTFLLGHYFS